jgi:outer membrane receptor for ferrienterochelin and colicin
MANWKFVVFLMNVIVSSAIAQDDTLQKIELKAVEIRSQQNTVNTLTRKVEILTTRDLQKDACCNLSESFENTATVDANYADAVSGARHIRLLGLDGKYVHFTSENIPGIRGLQQTFGLNFVPGPWMHSIQINKGAGSVINGYESITGQINIEFKKPQNSEKLFANLYLNQDVRTELNVLSAQKSKNEKWSCMTFVHGFINWLPMDLNRDEFVDNPLVKQANLMQRFTYQSGKKFNFIGAISGTFEDRQSGQVAHLKSREHHHPVHELWQLRLKTKRMEAFAKTGFILNDVSSIGVQYKYFFHQQFGNIGTKKYDAIEHFGYINLIYQYEFLERSFLKLGSSFLTDKVEEKLDSFLLSRWEMVPGVFAEATYDVEEKINFILGARADYHNLFGPFFSPRFHVKWNILYDLSLRLSAGKAYHIPTIFAENFGFLANNRSISLPSKIKPEQAWSVGGSTNYRFYLDFREGNISVDFFHTRFTNQLITDLENPRELSFYNLNGKSYSNSLQVEMAYELIPRFDAKIAYRFEDVRTTFRSGFKWVPLRPRHKSLIALEYILKNERWRFNTHLTWYGLARVPSTATNEPQFRIPERSKNYFLLNAQITYIHKKFFEVYVGVENILNQTQPMPVIGLNGFQVTPQFDASLVWGPIRGVMVFAGLRFTIP